MYNSRSCRYSDFNKGLNTMTWKLLNYKLFICVMINIDENVFFVCAVNITTRFLYPPLSLFFSSRPEHKFYEKQFTLQTNKLTHYNHGDMSSSMRQILVHQCTYTYASMYRYVYTSVHMHVLLTYAPVYRSLHQHIYTYIHSHVQI